jgi:hypothetical protein
MTNSIPRVTALCAALLLGACGGGDDSAETPAAPASFSAQAEAAHGPADRSEPPAGGPITRAEADRMDRVLRGDVVWVDAGCCSDDIDLVALIAYGNQAAKNLGNDVPFLVTGNDAQLVARVVERMAQSGITRAYRVVS